jgi:hypothetical protein
MKCLCFELFNLAVTGDMRLSVGDARNPLQASVWRIVDQSACDTVLAVSYEAERKEIG